jgi:RNA polymerase sigma factor (sigma-70 family)
MKSSRSMMAAVVIGTALAAAPAEAAPAAHPKAVEDISRYCQACWRNARLPADRWLDCTQQVFVRLLERISTSAWADVLKDDGVERKEFLRAIDAVKKRTQRARVAAMLPDEHPDRVSPELQEQRTWLAETANKSLSDRQAKIVELTTSGWAVPEIANELGTTVERISDEKYKAIRKLRSLLN